MDKKLNFSFIGRVSSSKSLFNRALIIKSFFPHFKIHGESQCEDVLLMEKAVESIGQTQEFECGSAGTVLRFLTVRLAREKGIFFIRGSKRLFERPQDELEKLVLQLGGELQRKDDHFVLKSQGWKLMGDGIHISGTESSQFASAVCLSAWGFSHPLFISIRGALVSDSYLAMTVEFLRKMGMDIRRQGSEIVISKNQRLTTEFYDVETDMSSTFAVAALAVMAGTATFTQFPKESLQPDFIFPSILQKMGVAVDRTEKNLKVSSPEFLLPIEIALTNTPDLFPILAVLCAFAKGKSHLKGAAHLKFKESNRIEKVYELLQKMGRTVEIQPDGLIISGEPKNFSKGFSFDPDQDHRLAMAAAIAMKAGFDIQLQHSDVVNKSFPEFWTIFGN